MKITNRKEVSMVLDSQEIVTKNNNVNNMGEIIGKGLTNPVVKHICMQGKNKNSAEVKKIQSEFSRFVGFAYYLGVRRILKNICC